MTIQIKLFLKAYITKVDPAIIYYQTLLIFVKCYPYPNKLLVLYIKNTNI